MKYLNILFALFLPLIGFGQYDDDVLYTMYRYHPQKQIAAQKIDTCFISVKHPDSLALDQAIVYGKDGRERKALDYGSGLEYIYTYNKSGNLIRSQLIDWDFGEGPVDSFVFNKEGQLVKRLSLFMGKVDRSTEIKYKDDLIVEEISNFSKTKYSYKDGKRTGYLRWTSKGIEEYIYLRDSLGRLVTIYRMPEKQKKKELRFKLDYNDANLLTRMESYNNGQLGQRYTYTYDNSGLITSMLQETGLNTSSPNVVEFVYRYE